MIIAGIFLCKLCAVLASSGSGAPGGVFTPTLFIGLAIGMLYGRSLGLWFLMAKKLHFTRIDRDGDTVGGDHARADYVDVDDM